MCERSIAVVVDADHRELRALLVEAPDRVAQGRQHVLPTSTGRFDRVRDDLVLWNIEEHGGERAKDEVVPTLDMKADEDAHDRSEVLVEPGGPGVPDGLDLLTPGVDLRENVWQR